MARTARFDRFMAVIETFSMAAFAGSTLWLLVRVVRGLVALEPSPAVWLVPVVVGCYVLADLVTGFLHFLGDHFYEEDQAFVGPAFVLRFRSHHRDQNEILTLGFRERNGGHVLISLPIVPPAVILLPIDTSAWALLLAVGIWAFSLFAVSTNQVHAWAHMAKPPGWVRLLQRSRLLLDSERHAPHHQPPHCLHFCILNGWLNPLLDRTGFWVHAAHFLIAIGVPQARDSTLGLHGYEESSA